VVVLAGVLGLFIFQLLQFVSDVPEITNKIMAWYSETFSVFTADTMIDKESIDNYLEENVVSLFSTTGGILSFVMGGITSTITFLVLVPVYTFMLLSYRRNFKAFVVSLKAQKKFTAETIADKTVQMTGRYLTGLFTVILVMCVVNSTALYIMGVNYFVFFGCFAALLILIPYIGAIVGSFLPIIYCIATEDDYVLPLIVAGYFLVAQILEGNFITPKIVGRSVNVNPLTVIVAVIIGSMLWGLIGMILAVPLAATLRIILYNNEELKPFSILMADKIEKDT
jgi:putative heme transporter